jgi:ribosome-associated translation inhibitor RaiA
MLTVIVNSDNQVDVTDEVRAHVEETILRRLGRFEGRLTRIVAHVGDVNSRQKGGDDDIRCMLEARPEGMDSINVTHHGADLNDALSGATKKLTRVLDDTFGRLNDPKGRPPAGRPEK